MKLISFTLTRPQIESRRKTVTRRLGWTDLRPGQLLCACDQIMGLQGKPLVRLAVIVVVSVERQPLNLMMLAEQYGQRECVNEGFPELNEYQFVKMFCEHMGCKPETEVTRIEFWYVPGGRLFTET